MLFLFNERNGIFRGPSDDLSPGIYDRELEFRPYPEHVHSKGIKVIEALVLGKLFPGRAGGEACEIGVSVGKDVCVDQLLDYRSEVLRDGSPLTCRLFSSQHFSTCTLALLCCL